jgi:hypothetical protein
MALSFIQMLLGLKPDSTGCFVGSAGVVDGFVSGVGTGVGAFDDIDGGVGDRAASAVTLCNRDSGRFIPKTTLVCCISCVCIGVGVGTGTFGDIDVGVGLRAIAALFSTQVEGVAFCPMDTGMPTPKTFEEAIGDIDVGVGLRAIAALFSIQVEGVAFCPRDTGMLTPKTFEEAIGDIDGGVVVRATGSSFVAKVKGVAFWPRDSGRITPKTILVCCESCGCIGVGFGVEIVAAGVDDNALGDGAGVGVIGAIVGGIRV